MDGCNLINSVFLRTSFKDKDDFITKLTSLLVSFLFSEVDIHFRIHVTTLNLIFLSIQPEYPSFCQNASRIALNTSTIYKIWHKNTSGCSITALFRHVTHTILLVSKREFLAKLCYVCDSPRTVKNLFTNYVIHLKQGTRISCRKLSAWNVICIDICVKHVPFSSKPIYPKTIS